MPKLTVYSSPYAAVRGMARSAWLDALGRGEAPAGFPAVDRTLVPAGEDNPYVDRAKLVESLGSAGAALGGERPHRMRRVLRGEGRMIIAGQQPGLLLGPMYGLLKAITVVAAAERWGGEAGDSPLVPAFWMATEDHDIEEVNHCYVRRRRFTCDHAEMTDVRGRPPVGWLPLAKWKQPLLRFLADALATAPHCDWVLEAVAETPFDDYGRMFGSLLGRVLDERAIAIVDPMRMRELLAPPLADLVERWPDVMNAFEQGAEAMRAAGFDPPIERVGLFEFADGRRKHCAVDREGFVFSTGRASFVEAADMIRDEPARFSPGAAIRPVVQDAALPVAATIGGPTELLYLWQIDPIYDVLGVQRSRLAMRISATFADRGLAERAEAVGLTGAGLLDAGERLERLKPRRALDADDLDDLAAHGRQFIRRIDSLDVGGQRITADRARRAIAYHVGKVIDVTANERLSRQGRGKDTLTEIADEVYPLGEPQERVMNPIELIARYGPRVVEAMIETLGAEAGSHHVVEVAGDDAKEGTAE